MSFRQPTLRCRGYGERPSFFSSFASLSLLHPHSTGALSPRTAIRRRNQEPRRPESGNDCLSVGVEHLCQSCSLREHCRRESDGAKQPSSSNFNLVPQTVRTSTTSFAATTTTSYASFTSSVSRITATEAGITVSAEGTSGRSTSSFTSSSQTTVTTSSGSTATTTGGETLPPVRTTAPTHAVPSSPPSDAPHSTSSLPWFRSLC